jgi:signal transduction histidine kinase
VRASLRSSVGRRLVRMNAVTISVALLLASGAFLAYELVTFRRGMVSSLATHADVIATNAESALLFDDDAAAIQTLAALRAAPHIVSVHLLRENGKPFAAYVRAGALAPPASPPEPDTHRFGRGSLTLSRRVESGGVVIGTVVVQADLQEMATRFKRYSGIVVAVLFFSLLVGLLLSARLQRRITRPILEMASAARTVSDERDYSVRVDARMEDELGTLAGTFNEMLVQIETRDQELTLARDQLEARVAERTKDLEQESAERMRLADELRERNRELSTQNMLVLEATRMKSEFLANMSHELRTPLNAIIGFTELLYDGRVAPDSPHHRDFLGEVLTASRHLLRLINEVLDLARVEAGKMDFSPETFDVRDLAEEVRDTLRTLAALKKLRVAIEIAPGLGAVHVDRARLKQVFYNYLSNAIKFTDDDGDIVIRVKPEGPDEFRVEVEDTGIGIREQDIGGLFARFHQLDATTGKRYGGTGLGLALTGRILEAQGGRHGVRSALGQGSTFFAILPRVARVDEHGRVAMAGGDS